jgi:predicted phage-related endonuclease
MLNQTNQNIDQDQDKNQEQHVPSLNKKKNKPQGVVLNNTVKQTSLTPSLIPQTIEQARKFYAVSSDNIAKQNIIEANELIAEKVAELHKLEELHQKLLCTENNLKLEVMNYMQLHTHLKKGDYILASWKSSTRKTFEIPKFKDEFPDLYAIYIKEISTRTFRLY